jgi:ribosomal peptide maturation radical SAM protein 1
VNCAALDSVIPDADALIVVPPFANLYRPALGAHLLAACAREAGFRVAVLYANMLFAMETGEDLYNTITDAPCTLLLGERVFSTTAFGTQPHRIQRKKLPPETYALNSCLTIEEFERLEEQAFSFCNSVACYVVRRNYLVVGASTTFEQTNASIALLKAVKAIKPETITIIGGPNCEGDMANGIATLSPQIDYVFSGECEKTFPEFLRQTVSGRVAPLERIIRGPPTLDLDALPEPEFSEYFNQLQIAIPNWKERPIWLPYETSRGCWWGVKRHCTFCGLNGETIAFRHKSPSRIIAALNSLMETNGVRLICMTDNIMPHVYFRTLLPRLVKEIPPAHIFYEQKSNITLEQMRLLQQAGVRLIQPGIEALSSSLLRHMEKGVLARQNIALLRYARSLGVATNWNLLADFPGDEHEDYEQTLKIIPLLRHLHPPSGVNSIVIDRFSPYFDAPDRYGISNCRPVDGYAFAFPESAPLEQLAYHFTGDFRSACRESPELLSDLKREVEAWKAAWTDPKTLPPQLEITPLGNDTYLLLDTRGLPQPEIRFLRKEEARVALMGCSLKDPVLSEWAAQECLAVELDGRLVPLATSDYETLREFELALKGRATPQDGPSKRTETGNVDHQSALRGAR